ncbi:MAG: 5'-nucleotidase C-terminal domain-containing protein [Chromatiaceae bacterium]|nr:5'-nucleotidase C-terminal domain-containing protein [Chromatiaceae bacterium]MCP5422440.1 5'-nucleotidase C-terminal domain-containing protein [Chromatiaceae bacterium]
MKARLISGRASLCMLTLVCSVMASTAFARGDVTLIAMGDLHGTLVPHPAVLKNDDGSEREVPSAGGLARLKTVVDDIRTDNPHAVLLSVGDLTHGSAEALFTVGDAMMVAMNAFGIDVFTPGNWDFGYGPAVFRDRFASTGPFPTIPPNIRVMSKYVGCGDVPLIPGLTDPASGYTCSEVTATAPNPTPAGFGVIRAQFPVVAANLYNDAPLPNRNRTLPAYHMLERDGVKIAVIGITAAIVPQQADVYNIGLQFTQGIAELPGLIAEVKAAGTQLIVVQSELGLSQNIKIAQSFEDIDVMYSAHTHEVTLGALLADRDGVVSTTPGRRLSGSERRRLARGAAIVVETNRDMYVGRLDLHVAHDRVIDFTWNAIPVDGAVAEDPEMAALVASIEEPFLIGPGLIRHTFMPAGFCTPPDSPANCGDTTVRGLQLVEGLDTIVGATDTLLLRHHVLEDTLNNFIADAIWQVSNSVTPVDLSMANGFRFGNAVLPGGLISLRDLYTWFPIAPAVNYAEFSGQSIKRSLDTILGAVFDRNVFMQRGGWYVGLANMEQSVDLRNRPLSSSSGRSVDIKIGGVPLDPGGRYRFASCYGHGNPLDEVCRTGGGAGFKFFALANPDDYTSAIGLVDPVNDPSVEVVVGSTVQQVAPDTFLHPVHALRRFLDALPDYMVTEAQFGVGRVTTVDSTLVGNPQEMEAVQIGQPDNTPDNGFVQPPFGAGPAFFSGSIGH